MSFASGVNLPAANDKATIWLFDSDCVLCSGAVQYVLKFEKQPSIHFISIQSAEGRKLALDHDVDPDDPSTFLFIDGGIAYKASDAVLALLRHVRGPAQLLNVFRLFPRRLRDVLYYQLARNRYRWFGKTNACLMPDEAMRRRFVLPQSK